MSDIKPNEAPYIQAADVLSEQTCSALKKKVMSQSPTRRFVFVTAGRKQHFLPADLYDTIASELAAIGIGAANIGIRSLLEPSSGDSVSTIHAKDALPPELLKEAAPYAFRTASHRIQFSPGDPIEQRRNVLPVGLRVRCHEFLEQQGLLPVRLYFTKESSPEGLPPKSTGRPTKMDIEIAVTAVQSGTPIHEVAAQLGRTEEAIRRWVQE